MQLPNTKTDQRFRLYAGILEAGEKQVRVSDMVVAINGIDYGHKDVNMTIFLATHRRGFSFPPYGPKSNRDSLYSTKYKGVNPYIINSSSESSRRSL